MEDAVDKLLVELVGAAGVEQGVIDIGGAVVEGREEEAQLVVKTSNALLAFNHYDERKTSNCIRCGTQQTI